MNPLQTYDIAIDHQTRLRSASELRQRVRRAPERRPHWPGQRAVGWWLIELGSRWATVSPGLERPASVHSAVGPGR